MGARLGSRGGVAHHRVALCPAQSASPARSLTLPQDGAAGEHHGADAAAARGAEEPAGPGSGVPLLLHRPAQGGADQVRGSQGLSECAQQKQRREGAASPANQLYVRPREALRRWPRAGRRGDRLLRRKDSRQCPRFLQEEDRLSDQTDGENSAGTTGKTCHETSCDGNDEPEDPAANGHWGFPGCSHEGITFGIGSPGPARCGLTVAFCSVTSRVLKSPRKQLGPKPSRPSGGICSLCWWLLRVLNANLGEALPLLYVAGDIDV